MCPYYHGRTELRRLEMWTYVLLLMITKLTDKPEAKSYRCHDKVSPQWLGHAEAILYAIEEINKDKLLLPNFTLGYDIRDICTSEINAARYAYQFATASTMNCKEVRCISNHSCFCIVNGSSVDKECLFKNYSTTSPVVAIVGKMSSGVAIPMANFLQAVRIPLMGTSATSEELSMPVYNNILRTIPSDINQARVFADFIERFGWRYVAAVATDDSYGRYGVRALERESIQRKTFCLELFGYAPMLKYKDKLKAIVSSLKLRKTVKVIIVWAHSIFGRSLLVEGVKQGVENRIWMFSEAVAMLRPEYLSSIHNLSSTGIHVGFKVRSEVPESFLQYLESKLVRNRSDEEHFWWKQFWKSVAMNKTSYDNTIPKRNLLHRAHDDFVIYIIDAIYSIAHALDRMLSANASSSSTGKNMYPNSNETVQTGKLIEYLKNVEFEGVTGKVQFDSRGDPLEAIYDIVYFNISKIKENERITKDVIGRSVTLCCSALFLETMQIVHAFNISRHKNWVKAFVCSTKRQVIVLLAIISIEVFLGAGWILLDPPYAHVTIVPKRHVHITCVPFRDVPGKVLESLMLVYLLLVAGCCIYYAYRARNLPAHFNEAKHISFSIYIFLLSWITYYPVDYAAEGWYVAVLSGTTLLLSSYGLLFCIFGPKIYIIIWHPEKNTVEFIRSEMRQNHLTQKINNCNSVKPNETAT
ncbi:extracellular calcium-sensing receptor-like [Actinia tenebrosa]|uniref:Extracellular calcium-sensing receptor-like n=1 Tax=Actinia tenebrosa TaxID=6105 RepID=A0A6P8JCY7_ACTTE|nr:extracellular calcium-sensing receptor-like [Actinia tenebrosa]